MLGEIFHIEKMMGACEKIIYFLLVNLFFWGSNLPLLLFFVFVGISQAETFLPLFLLCAVPAGPALCGVFFSMNRMLKGTEVSAWNDIFGLKTIFISEITEIILYLHTEDSQYTPVVKQIMEEVRKNYKEDMNLKTLAYKYHMNASYLGQIFQKEVGCSFTQYLSNTKNKIAKDLILNTNMKINDIAKEVGYPDTSYFYRKFKQCYGVSPASLRNMKKY